STRPDISDKIRALELGADVYLVKPFSLEELLAEVGALYRRARAPEGLSPVIRQGRVRVDLRARSVTLDGNEVRLSPTEWLGPGGAARNGGGPPRPPQHR